MHLPIRHTIVVTTAALTMLPLAGCVVVIGDRSDGAAMSYDASGSSKRVGIVMGRPSPALCTQLGVTSDRAVVVTNVVAGSSADHVGIKQYDVITGVDGSEWASPATLRDTVRAKNIGEPVELRIVRSGETMNISVPIEARPSGNYYYN